MQYKNPNGTPSSVGTTQFNTFFYVKKALIEAAKQQFFSRLADTTSMPKNMGKTLKRYHYLPILDDANINDQGLDATGSYGVGVPGEFEYTIIITPPGVPAANRGNPHLNDYAVGNGATAGAAQTAAEAVAMNILKNKWGVTSGTQTYVAYKAAAEALATPFVITTQAAVPGAGNLYGSSKDVGYINGKMPVLSETGGRVNKVGFRRVELEGTLKKYGFYSEYTQESLDFDTDAELEMHFTREMVNAANEINEDLIQIDLLNAAGVTRYGGAATSLGGITGDGTASLVTWIGLVKLATELNLNRCPTNTKMITGSQMTDTRVIPAARFMHVGPELVPTLRKLLDHFGQPAFISVEKYGAATTPVAGEIGTIADFRIIVVDEMMRREGVGANVGAAANVYRNNGVKYDAYPMLVVGSEAFTTVGFQTSGDSAKFTIKHKKPSDNIDRNDPYGEVGFMSIKWYYGSMVLRPERIAVYWTVCEW
jgi:N4-gp56 family major capsid protein